MGDNKNVYGFDKCNKCSASPIYDIYDGGDGERAWLCDEHYAEWLGANGNTDPPNVLPVVGGRVGYKWAIRPSRFWQFLHDDNGYFYSHLPNTYGTPEEAVASFAPDAKVTILEVVEDNPERAWRLYLPNGKDHQVLEEVVLGAL